MKITIDRTVIEQALEALETSEKYLMTHEEWLIEAITSLRSALTESVEQELEQEMAKGVFFHCNLCLDTGFLPKAASIPEPPDIKCPNGCKPSEWDRPMTKRELDKFLGVPTPAPAVPDFSHDNPAIYSDSECKLHWKDDATKRPNSLLHFHPATAVPECKCDMRTKLVGDGCSVCNPEYAASIEVEQLRDELAEWRQGARNLQCVCAKYREALHLAGMVLREVDDPVWEVREAARKALAKIEEVLNK